ncbi:hypothetical protein CALVIDRAFT_560498 [Calocera viscosa TUFC12733]|uniref:Uncharacterized protein n=1 Tax=Calocera viscosa (strain TUFC12733) TaxID=1330018 RepID=A0A167R3Z4_CALVF|nr:hypothetical protein CALVIDRAFT_560498 [Calocera viscosa TUFC12733]
MSTPTSALASPPPAAGAAPSPADVPVEPAWQARKLSPPTEPRASRLARYDPFPSPSPLSQTLINTHRVAEEVVAALDARKRAIARGDKAGLADDMLRGSMRVLDDIIQESAAMNASYNAGRWAGRGNR